MKTAIASDPGDDDEGRHEPCSFLRQTFMFRCLAGHADNYGMMPVMYNGGAAPTSTWLISPQAGWAQNGGAAPTSDLLLPTFEKLTTLLRALRPMRPSDAYSSADLNLNADTMYSHNLNRYVGQVKAYEPSQAQETIDTSASFHRPVSRRSWSAKLGPVTVTMRLLYQRGWLRLPNLSPNWLTGAAVFLAGKKRSEVRDEWRCHLYGWPDRRLSREEQVRAARAFLVTAVRYRLQDTADLGWQAVDAVLKSRTLSNLFVWVPVLVAMLAIVHHERLYGLIANADNLTALWGVPYAAIKVGRRCRRVKPGRKPRRAKE
jgi:hypothetical protein